MNFTRAGKLAFLKAFRKGKLIWQIQHKNAKRKYFKNLKFCGYCKERLSYRNRFLKFCSQTCAAIFNNSRKEKKKRFCLICKKTSKKYEGGTYAKHCPSCIKSGVAYSWVRIKKIEDAKTNGSRRSLLLRNRGHQCEKCSRIRWNGKPIPLEMHHKDGDSKNNSEKNLELLCPNCHAQTDNFKNKSRK